MPVSKVDLKRQRDAAKAWRGEDAQPCSWSRVLQTSGTRARISQSEEPVSLSGLDVSRKRRARFLRFWLGPVSIRYGPGPIQFGLVPVELSVIPFGFSSCLAPVPVWL